MRSILSLLLFSSFLFVPSDAGSATSREAMAVTAHPLATATALEVLEQGGNAIDAAIAAQWVLNVVEPHSSGIGGGGFLLYYEASTGRIYAFDGRETAPAQTFPYKDLGEGRQPIPHFPDRVTGGHAVGVPGTLRLLKTVHDRFGSEAFFFASLFQPAIQLAEKGFPVSQRLAEMIQSEKSRLAFFESTKNIFFDERGEPLQAGDILVQRDLAQTFRLIQRDGINSFYEGEIAEDIAEAVQKAAYRPGSLTVEDLCYYRVIQREAVHGTYRGYDVFSMGPPSSGGTTVIETLNIFENFEVSPGMPDSAWIPLFSEAQRLAFEDRNRYLGDPAFVKIPLGRILSKKYAAERAKNISGLPATSAFVLSEEPSHTSHLSIVDSFGNIVSYTTTIEYIFGSGMVVPGRGFLLNNELSDFDAVPRDEYRRLKPNAAESEKRPRSSMAPTIVFYKGEPFAVLGSPGGPKIIAAVLNTIINLIDFELSPQEAAAKRRIANLGNGTLIEQNGSGLPELKPGHHIEQVEPFGNVQMIHFDGQAGKITGVSDPRGEGSAAGI